MNQIFIILLFVSMISFSQALSIDFDCPEKINQNIEFECSLEIFEGEGIYDFKLDLQKDSKNIARIYDEETDSFRSSFYYLNEFIEYGIEKKVRIIIEESGNLEGLIKLRKDSSVEEFNLSIKVEANGDVLENNEVIEEENEEIEKNEDFLEDSIKETSEEKPVETIWLSSPKVDLATEKVLIYESKSSKIVKNLSYFFSGFLILLIFFLIRDKLR